MRALVVEDKEENAYYLRVLLESRGWVVDVARHGAEALVKARQTPPEVIFSDLLMPVMDGYTLLRHWKADPRLQRAPFIVYTATYTEPEDERLALSLGADAFILKPCEPEELIARLQGVFAGLSGPKMPEDTEGADHSLLTLYSETLIRKLEKKTLQLEEANRALQQDIAARQVAEAKLKLSEEQLRQAQKMQAIGQLAGGIAHDFNNLLTVILGYTSMLMDNFSEGDPPYSDLLEIKQAGERARDLTRQLLTFSQKQVLRPQLLNLNKIVLKLERMLGRLIGEDVRLSVVTCEGLGWVFADLGQLEQVIVNLVVNARDAMPTGGALCLETSEITLEESPVDYPNVAPGRYVVLSVRDAGHGMDTKTLTRIFEPFFTTKEKGKGTGLGLSMVYGIVTQSGGHMKVQSEPGVGTTMSVHLPRVEAAPELEAPAVVPVGEESILLVEADEPARAAAASVLRQAGYQVIEAADGPEALRISAQHRGEIHLLLTDLRAPHHSAQVLAAQLAATRPTLKSLSMSEHAKDPTSLLSTPASSSVLLRSVREALFREP